MPPRARWERSRAAAVQSCVWRRPGPRACCPGRRVRRCKEVASSVSSVLKQTDILLPGHDRDTRPSPPPAVGLLFVLQWQIVHVVGADDHRKDIVEPEWRIHLVAAAGSLTQSMGGASRQEAVDALTRAAQRALGDAELLGDTRGVRGPGYAPAPRRSGPRRPPRNAG